MAANHVQIPFAPPPNLHVRFHVRPLLYIKQNPYISTFTRIGSHCKGAGALSDLKRGASVTIYNAGGRKVIGLGYIVKSFISRGRCGLVADVKNLPPVPFYQVRFTSHNKLPFSARQLITQGGATIFG